MAYLQLVVTPKVRSLSTDGTQLTIEDNTGEYPASPGGFAPTPGDPERPAESEIQFISIFRLLNPDYTWNEAIPPTQNGADRPWYFDITTNDGFIYQVVEITLPAATDWATYYAGKTWSEIVEDALGNYALGWIPVGIMQEQLICVNQSRAQFMNAAMKGRCCKGGFYLKGAMEQGIVSTLAQYPNYANPLDAPAEALILAAQLEVEALDLMCVDDNCCDDC